jgi:drug/metabolite transporter (DMT)-like permease
MHPFWVATDAHFLIPKDRLTALKIGGLLLAFIGLFAAFRSRSATLEPGFWIGDLLELAAAFFWAATTLYIKKIAGTRDITPYRHSLRSSSSHCLCSAWAGCSWSAASRSIPPGRFWRPLASSASLSRSSAICSGSG